MTSAFRRLTLLLVCAAIALGTPLSGSFAAGQEPPCESGMSQDAGGTPDCCGGETAPGCAEHCAALHVGATLAAASSALGVLPEGDPVVRPFAAGFESRAGPPGLQPPR